MREDAGKKVTPVCGGESSNGNFSMKQLKELKRAAKYNPAIMRTVEMLERLNPGRAQEESDRRWDTMLHAHKQLKEQGNAPDTFEVSF